MADFLDLDPYVVKAELIGILKVIPRKKDMCEHVTCGFKKAQRIYDWQKNKYVTTSEESGLVKCSWERYKKCTTQELSNPDVTADSIFAAIRVCIVHKGGWSNYPEVNQTIFLHDLYTDKTKDRWFQNGSTNNASIQPNIQIGSDYPKPTQIVNLKEVIEGMKKVL